MKNKKAQLDWLASFILILLAIIIVSYLVGIHMGRGDSALHDYTDDFDKDDVPDSIDNCGCDKGLTANRGCPLGECVDGYTDEQRELCKKKMAGEEVGAIC